MVQLGLERAVGTKGAKGRPAEVRAMRDALRKPVRKFTHGGARPGSGRKPTGEKAGESHRRRREIDARHPVHVTLRVVKEVGRMRRRSGYGAWRGAMRAVIGRGDFRVVHVSIQANHVHLVCEADDRVALANGVRALSISAARRLNEAVGKDRGCEARRGRVFADRYHADVMDSPRKCRNVLAYVINNWRRHGEDRGLLERRAQVDPYSSGVRFDGWAGRNGRPFVVPEGYEALPVAAPTTWLLRVGWRRAGEIAVREVPGREGT